MSLFWISEKMQFDTPTNFAVAVTSTGKEVLAANSDRKYAVLINNSAVNAFVALGAAATTGSGILLKANGGTYEISGTRGNLYKGAINGKSTAASSIVGVEGK